MQQMKTESNNQPISTNNATIISDVYDPHTTQNFRNPYSPESRTPVDRKRLVVGVYVLSMHYRYCLKLDESRGKSTN